jgi:glycine/D-amino acid oxidase-like deaminating enzyme
MNSSAGKADIVICGAGIAGIATAYFLSRQCWAGSVLLVDERPPLSLTSDKSSEGYRNWWPGPDDAMVRLMDRSIDLMEGLARESDNRFHMNRRGYVYLTADRTRIPAIEKEASEIAELGAGPLRREPSYQAAAKLAFDAPVRGADLIRDQMTIHKQYPFLNGEISGLLHARRCGWLSAQQLGMLLLEQACAAGVDLLQGRVSDVKVAHNRVEAVYVRRGSREIKITTRLFVNAAGPYAGSVAALMGIDLPLTNELHGKIAFEDSLGIIPRDAPLMIWNDPLTLPWQDEEQEDLASFADTAWMVEPLPAGLHFRPEGGPGSRMVLVLWPYHIQQCKSPVWPLAFDAEFVEIVMRGMAHMIPDLAVYLERMSPPFVDGGYYTKTPENRPLIGPLPASGAYVIGGLSGYGIMAAMASAELLAAHICGSELPPYAPSFQLSRYDDPQYRMLLENWDAMAGQL